MSKNMFSRINALIGYIALTIILSGCISLFEPPKDMSEISNILVVDGVILEEGTSVKLSRIVKLDEDINTSTLFPDVNLATVQIIDENLNTIAVATQETNFAPYTVKEKIAFVPGMKYALDITIRDGKQYRSAFMEPVDTPEIDELTYQVNEDKSVDIMVSTHDPSDETLYCLWSFEETWEIRSRYFQVTRFDPITGNLVEQNLNGDNRYYCWASFASQSMLLASSEKFESAIIKNNKIHTLLPLTSRYSYLYSIKVIQYRLDKGSYQYFENMQRNMDESGSLFAPQPSEMTGNIQ
ncbi:MAG: DUF4249 domain-containing protein, partial [Tannerella sp.]|nr:DUF4249 domain-containing protein [Tannerella sp.]